MNSFFAESVFFGFVITLLGYMLGLWLNKKIKFMTPILTAMIAVVAFLLIFDIDVETYQKGGTYISYFLTPATVCLTIPLYRQLSLLKKYKTAILISIFSGAVTAILCVFVMAFLFAVENDIYVSLLPKSITTAIGMEVARSLGGFSEIAIASIMITGIFGNAAGEWILKLFRIKNPVAVGLALGTSAHAIGTAKALELGEIQGAMSSLSITVTGLLTVIIAPLFAGLI